VKQFGTDLSAGLEPPAYRSPSWRGCLSRQLFRTFSAMLVRLIVFTAITCGFAAAAEQALPAPLSSAIKRMVTGDGLAQNSAKPPDLTPQALTLANVDKPATQCSIPLKEYRIPADKRFLIREVPVPGGPTPIDGMKILRAPVCDASTDGSHPLTRTPKER